MARQRHRYQHINVPHIVPHIRVRRGGAGGGWPATTCASQLIDALHVIDVDVLALGVLAEFRDRQCVELQGVVGQGRGVLDESREVEACVHGDVLLGDLEQVA
jgi:hypothetical protein